MFQLATIQESYFSASCSYGQAKFIFEVSVWKSAYMSRLYSMYLYAELNGHDINEVTKEVESVKAKDAFLLHLHAILLMKTKRWSQARAVILLDLFGC